MEKNCKCGCGGTFNVNDAHPNQDYKKGHAPKAEMISCACGCGTMINSKNKWGKPRSFVDFHASGKRNASTRLKLQVVWKRRWLAQSNTMLADLEKGRAKLKVEYLQRLNDNFIQRPCACGCGRNLMIPFNSKRKVNYLKGHAPRNEVRCACGCGQLIQNPDKYGRRHTVILGHNSNLRDATFFSNICRKMRRMPTAPEQRVIKIISDFGLPFRYSGSGLDKEQDWIGRYNPDFISTAGKFVIDVQGNYYHQLPNNVLRDQRKKRFLNSIGYAVLYLWELELRSMDDSEIYQRIKSFVENKQ
jgi:G:T-mismatch repair DNA endonuclease (very short patch repair protein)